MNNEKNNDLIDNFLSLKANLTEEEKEEIYREHFGIDFSKPINYEEAFNSPIVLLLKREKNKEEILSYMIQKIMEEYNVSTDEEALDKWNDYKEKYNIIINEEF